MSCGYHGIGGAENVAQLAQQAVDAIKDARRFGMKVDAIAFRGMSGARVAPVVAFLLGIPAIGVRKEEEKSRSHSPCLVEADGADFGEVRYVIVDDFVSSGRTCCEIIEAINEDNEEARCVGVYEYKSGGLVKEPTFYRGVRRCVVELGWIEEEVEGEPV